MYTSTEIFNELERHGITAAAEYLPPMFKTAAGYDSESTTITERVIDRYKKDGTPVYRTNVKHCFCYAYQYAIYKDSAAIYRDPNDVIQVIRNTIQAVKFYNKLHDTNAVFSIGVANLSHEWSFIKKLIYDNFEITKIFGKSKRDILYVQLEECVEFRELIGLLGHSLDDISKNWCKSNNVKLTGTFDYNKIRTSATPLTETERAYMIHDVTSIVETLQNAIAHYTQPDGVCCLPYTSSGFVRTKLKNAIRADDDITGEREHYNFIKGAKIDNNIAYLKRKNRTLVTDAFQWSICREYGYAGGLCGSNINLAGKILKNVTCADLTSDYPAQLTHKKYPSGRLHRARGDLNAKRLELERDKKPFFAVLKIREIQAKTQHATLSKHKIINYDSSIYPNEGAPRHVVAYNGKIYHAENIIICVNDVDINAYRELYDFSSAVLALWYFDKYAAAPAWLLTSMWDSYEQKSILKARGMANSQEYRDQKRDTNTYYGVLATKVNDTFDDLDNDINLMCGEIKTFDDIRNNFWLNPYIAFYCTSYARAVLMHFIARYPDDIVQYDTDSLYFIDRADGLRNALLEYNAEIEKKNHFIFRDRPTADIFRTLGTWDFEATYKKFLGMGAKKYLKEDENGIHATIAGLPKKAIPAEIYERGIKSPFTYYNPLARYMRDTSNAVIIEHTFAHKFASIYDDRCDTYAADITDYTGATHTQRIGSYHAIIPIDFTLSMAYEYIKHIIKRRE